MSVPGDHSPEFAPLPEPSIETVAAPLSLVLLDVLQKKQVVRAANALLRFVDRRLSRQRREGANRRRRPLGRP